MRLRGLNKKEVEQLERDLRGRDVIAERQGKPVTHGRIEDIENAMVPWLRARRRARRPR